MKRWNHMKALKYPYILLLLVKLVGCKQQLIVAVTSANFGTSLECYCNQVIGCMPVLSFTDTARIVASFSQRCEHSIPHLETPLLFHNGDENCSVSFYWGLYCLQQLYVIDRFGLLITWLDKCMSHQKYWWLILWIALWILIKMQIVFSNHTLLLLFLVGFILIHLVLRFSDTS